MSHQNEKELSRKENAIDKAFQTTPVLQRKTRDTTQEES